MVKEFSAADITRHETTVFSESPEMESIKSVPVASVQSHVVEKSLAPANSQRSKRPDPSHCTGKRGQREDVQVSSE